MKEFVFTHPYLCCFVIVVVVLAVIEIISNILILIQNVTTIRHSKKVGEPYVQQAKEESQRAFRQALNLLKAKENDALLKTGVEREKDYDNGYWVGLADARRLLENFTPEE